MERFRDYLGVSPEVFIAYLIRQGTCTQAKLIQACTGIQKVATRLESADAKAAAAGEPSTEGDLDRESLAKLGVLPPLILLLNSKQGHSEVVQIEGLKCLNLLCKTYSIKAQVVQLDILDHVRPLLQKTQTLEMVQLLLKLVGFLAGQEDNQVILARKKFVPAILHHVENPDELVKERIANALANMAVNSINQAIIGEQKGVEALLGFTQAHSPEREEEDENGDLQTFGAFPLVKVQEQAARGLWNLCGNADNRKTLADLGGIEILGDLMKGTAERLIKAQVAGCFGNIALDESGRTVLIEQSAAELLMELCYEEDAHCQRNATASLSNLALDETTREELMLMGCVETMVDFIKNAECDPLIRRGAAGVLWNVALTQDNRMTIADEGGLVALLDLAHPNNFEISQAQAAATGCLAVLCMESAIRDRIVNEDKLGQIIHLTKSADENVQSAAAEVIECFLVPEYMETLQDQGGITALQLYASSVVKRRRLAGLEKPRKPRDFEAAPDPHADKGTHSFATPPPHYRPCTPAPLYEIDAMEWWPNTGTAPLARTDPSGPHPHVTSEWVAPVALDQLLEGEVAEPIELDEGAPPEAFLFFQGARLATPIRRSPNKAAVPVGEDLSETVPPTALSSMTRSNLNTPSTPGALFAGRAQTTSSGSQRFYF